MSSSQIKDIMSPFCEWISPATSLQDAAQIMKKKDIGFLPIGENDKLIGTITDRDIVIHAIAAGKDPSTATARDIMTAKLYYCYDDQSVDDICKNMSEMKVSRFPVVNRNKRLVGTVSYADLSAAASPAAYIQGEQILKSCSPSQKAA